MSFFLVQQKSPSANFLHTSSQCLKKKKNKKKRTTVWKRMVSEKILKGNNLPFGLTNWVCATITPHVNPTKLNYVGIVAISSY